MAVSAVDSTSPYLSDIPVRTTTKELGKDDFLKLLITQMQYQDPLQPMDNNEYVAQMAQFSALEQMTNMTQSYNRTQAFELIGKIVTAIVENADNGTSELISGKVEKVTINGSDINLTVNGQEIGLGNITQVIGEDQISGSEVPDGDVGTN